MPKIIKKICEVLLCEIPILNRITQKIEIKMNTYRANGLSSEDKRTSLPLSTIQSHFEIDMARLQTVEDKARVNVAGITLALSLFFAGASQVATIAAKAEMAWWPLGYLIDALIIATASYFLAAGYYALRALRIKSIYRVTLEDELDFVDGREKVIRNLEVLDLNRMLISLHINEVEVSYNAIRNGIVCTALVIVILTIGRHTTTPMRPDIPDVITNRGPHTIKRDTGSTFELHDMGRVCRRNDQ